MRLAKYSIARRYNARTIRSYSSKISLSALTKSITLRVVSKSRLITIPSSISYLAMLSLSSCAVRRTVLQQARQAAQGILSLDVVRVVRASVSCVARCDAMPMAAGSFVDSIAIALGVQLLLNSQLVYVEVSYKAERRDVQQRAQAGESSCDYSRACKVVARQMLVGLVRVVVGKLEEGGIEAFV